MVKIKNSTRIALAATVLWFMFLYLGHEDRFNYHEMYGDGALSAFGFGLAAIWLLKFILGTFVDKKED